MYFIKKIGVSILGEKQKLNPTVENPPFATKKFGDKRGENGDIKVFVTIFCHQNFDDKLR